MSTRYEYRVIPAPLYGQRAQGVKGAQARFAHAVEEVMNEMALDGWEYQRADILPSEERQSQTPGATTMRSLLVFRRPIDDSVARDTHATARPAGDAAPSDAAAMPEDDFDAETGFDPIFDAEEPVEAADAVHAADMADGAEADAQSTSQTGSGRRKRRHRFTRTEHSRDASLSGTLRRRAEHMLRTTRDA
ncbi:DUF4177 domain-containing protein [Pseudooceanicola sp. LIPI14-2-Ac024]|uniref:DUF4177 domain-containing protein n=1 Tax=Pseudooceanicola sp. LIPI14-2-Ac024 TaxID=3344875 RepID=UPI0035D06E23